MATRILLRVPSDLSPQALLIRLAGLADQARRLYGEVSILRATLARNGRQGRLRLELEEVVESLEIALIYLTAQHENDGCTIAELERLTGIAPPRGKRLPSAQEVAYG